MSCRRRAARLYGWCTTLLLWGRASNAALFVLCSLFELAAGRQANRHCLVLIPKGYPRAGEVMRWRDHALAGPSIDGADIDAEMLGEGVAADALTHLSAPLRC